MNGRVYVQLPKRIPGWIHDPCRLPRKLSPNGTPLPVKRPKTAEDILLTTDITQSWRFDVDKAEGYSLLEDIMSKGGIVAIAGNYFEGQAPAPSASPFTPIA